MTAERPILDAANTALAVRFEGAISAVLDEVRGLLSEAAVATLAKGGGVEIDHTTGFHDVLTTLHHIATTEKLERDDLIRMLMTLSAVTATLDIENAQSDA